MRLWALAFLVGIALLQQFSHLPNPHFIWWLSAPTIFSLYWRHLRLPTACALGFAWALFFANLHLTQQLPSALEGKTILVTGYIASIPNPIAHGQTFLLQLKNLNNHPAHGFIHLMWINLNIHLHVGDEWNFFVSLKKPHGTLNPGGFDYEAFALQAGIAGNGSVRDSENNLLLSSHWYHYPIDRVRQFLQEKIFQQLPSSKTSPWITALAIGERHDIDSQEWQILRNTGTNHLMAIAGLHIGFLAVLAHFIVSAIWRRLPWLIYKIPAPHAGAIAALGIAFIYSAMAGFSIPTQRACAMLAIFLLTLLLRRNIVPWQAWSGAMLCVLLINPLSVLTESFWLSFGSVALIIYGVSGRLSPSGLWWKVGRIQWVIAVGLIPFSIWLFQQCSLISFLANSIAIPWVGFLVAPLSFFGAILLLFSPTLGGLVLQLADKILSVLWVVLSWLAHLSGAMWYQTIPHSWMLWAAVVAMVFLLLPTGFPGRYFSVIWFLPLLFYKPVTPNAGDAWLTLLDVGQGLSAVIQTQNHILVYDTGPRLSASYDMGDSVVAPFLHSLADSKIDMLVISHSDNDHSGGAAAILRQFPVLAIKTSAPELFKNAEYCLQGTNWNWDGVNFEFLYPTKDKLGLDNNSSCVLRVTSHNKHILLTGDIEKLAEKDLVNTERDSLAADILIAPHHGSKTSANENFIRSVHPAYVLFPVGYRNRYHFPNVSVIRKYQDLQVIQYDTANAGAIQFKLQQNLKIELPTLYRVTHKFYWNN